MSPLEHARERYVSLYRTRPRGEGPAWLDQLRDEAIGRFADQGFPSRRLEEWKYTNLEAVARQPFEPAGPGHAPIARGDVEAIAFPVFACSLFAFVNGRFEPRLSTPIGDPSTLHVESLAAALREHPERVADHLGRVADSKQHPFAALNTAFFEDGAVVTIPRGLDLEQPLHLVFVSTIGGKPTLSQPRVLVVAEPGSRATVLQDHVSVGEGPCFTNAVIEVVVDHDAQLDLVLLQRENPGTFHVSNLTCRQGRDSRFASHTLSLGGALVRNDLGVLLAEPGARARLNGLFLGSRDQVVDNHTLVDHAMPHGTSEELYKGILAGTSRGVFRGRVIVRPDAQKTDARQSNPNVLLSQGAEVDTKPQLEIYADDVKCSHGSSIGRLDDDALFYLCTRGIDEASARDLLARGFAWEVLGKLPVASLGECVNELLVERLHASETDG